MAGPLYTYSFKELGGAGNLADSVVAPTVQRPNEFTPTNPSVINQVNVAIAPPAPTTGTLNTTIQYAQAIANDSIAQFGTQATPVVVTLLETLDDAGDLASYLIQPLPKFWFGNIRIIMNGLTDAQRTTITNLDIGSQISVTKTFPKSTPSTVTQLMALEGISHDITPDRHIVTLYTNPARIYTYFIVGGYTTTTTRTNLIANPSFETDTTGWFANGSTNTRVAGTWGTGSWVYQVVATGTGLSGAYSSYASFSVSAGQTFTASFYAKSISGTLRTLQIGIAWFNAGGSQISTSTATQVLSTNSQRWSVTGTAPALATSALVTAYTTSTGTAGDTWQIDSCLVEQASSALPYFDGTYADTYTGYTLTTQGWSGTANASTSSATWGLNSSLIGSQVGDDTKGLG